MIMNVDSAAPVPISDFFDRKSFARLLEELDNESINDNHMVNEVSVMQNWTLGLIQR